MQQGNCMCFDGAVKIVRLQDDEGEAKPRQHVGHPTQIIGAAAQIDAVVHLLQQKCIGRQLALSHVQCGFQHHGDRVLAWHRG